MANDNDKFLSITQDYGSLYSDVCSIIDTTRHQLATAYTNYQLLMYWHIGARINQNVLGGKRGEYGAQIVSTLSTQLQEQYGGEYAERNLRRMMQFSQEISSEIVSTLSTQLTWSHVVEILPLKDNLQREFYLSMASSYKWSVRTLGKEIGGCLYQRTAIAGKDNNQIHKELSALRSEGVTTPDLVFKNPYFLSFTGLKGYYSERSLEDALINSIQQFLIELGTGFCFVERQKRMIIDGDDFYLDLLFYHRKLRRLIAIDLKTTRFHHEYKSQMELYLSWLNQNEREEGELPPLGLILCTEGSEEQIKYLEMDMTGIRVAHYYTELPRPEQLQEIIQRQIKCSQSESK